MDILIDILIGISMLAVVGSLFLGMMSFAKNASGDGSNKWMVWRVRTQVVAVGVLMVSLWWKSGNGG